MTITITKLAQQLGVDRGFLLKKSRREGIVTRNMVCMTKGGVQACKAVPVQYAKRLKAIYQTARKNASLS
jgi:hypothetical protein